MSSSQLGPYVIERVLGKGGMGVVYAAVHAETGQRAAVKVLAATLSGKSSFRSRFQGEIETLKRLKHPRIVEYFGYGEQDAQLYYAMELVDGASLQDGLRAGRSFSVWEVVKWATEIVSALKLAHDSGVIHRDLKPANLLLTADGHVKLTDFGIAKLFGGTSLTITGGMVGTPDYMSPEQAEGKIVTERSDLYALGGVILGLLARRPPFTGSSLPEILHAVRYEEPPKLRTFVPDAPRELESLVGDLLQKQPGNRPPTALVVAKRLREIQEQLEQSATHPPQPELAPAGTPQVVQINPSQDLAAYDVPTRLQAKSPIERTMIDEAGKASAKAQNRSPTLPKDNNPTADLAGDEDSMELWLSAAAATSVHGDLAEKSSVDRTGITQVDGAASVSRAAISHFTSAVEEERVRSLRAERERHTEYKQLLVQLLIGVGALAVIIGGGWYLRQPLAAGPLFERIRATVEEDPENGLTTAHNDIEDFLNHYPNDHHAATVRAWQLAIEQQITRRKTDRRLRRDDEGEQLEPVERWYADAMQIAVGRPEAALRQLEALIDTFGDDENVTARTQQVVDLAKQQRERLVKITQQWQQQSLELAQSRLQAAAKKEADGDRDGARRIYRGLVELYGDSSWAHEMLAVAREKLAE